MIINKIDNQIKQLRKDEEKLKKYMLTLMMKIMYITREHQKKKGKCDNIDDNEKGQLRKYEKTKFKK